MHISEANRQSEIQALPIPCGVRDFLSDLDAPEGMKSLFEAPYYFYSQGYPGSPCDWPQFEARKLLPLWEHRDEIFAVDVQSDPPEFLAFYLEAPGEYQSFGRSVFAMLFHMLQLHVWEYGGGTKALGEARDLAERLIFPDARELVEVLSDIDCSDIRIDEYMAKLV